MVERQRPRLPRGADHVGENILKLHGNLLQGPD